jgi:mannose-1-phosphate guanylyltransferase
VISILTRLLRLAVKSASKIEIQPRINAKFQEQCGLELMKFMNTRGNQPDNCMAIETGSFADSSPASRKLDQLWSIVLAGGNGERVGAFTHRWMGKPIPKQYCAFVGTRSMLQHTLARADLLGRRERQLIVIARTHQREAQSQLENRPPGTIIIQPENRDTLPGIFLPLTKVYAQDPTATVVIYPSDHFIHPEKTFKEVIASAVQAAEKLPDTLVLVGVPAHGLELEYGWISPGLEIWRTGAYSVRSVRQFIEKPSRAKAVEIEASGGVWNTLIVAVKAHTLWQLGWRYFPEIMRLFAKLQNAIGTSGEETVLDAIYQVMPSRNFSRDLLAPATSRIGVMLMEDVLWSDWGCEDRIVDTLDLIGKEPNFPMASLSRADESVAAV